MKRLLKSLIVMSFLMSTVSVQAAPKSYGKIESVVTEVTSGEISQRAEVGEEINVIFKTEKKGSSIVIDSKGLIDLHTSLISGYYVTTAKIDTSIPGANGYSYALRMTAGKSNVSFVSEVSGNINVYPENALKEGDSLQEAINKANTGDTIYLGEGTFAGVNVTKKIRLIGLPGSQVQGMIEVTANDVVISGLNYSYVGKDTLYGNIIVTGENVTIENSNFDAKFTSKLDGSAGTEGGYRFGLIRPLGQGFTLKNCKIKSNVMGIFGGSFKNAVISNNIFMNSDNYTSRTVAINSATLDNVTISGNTFDNRHLVLGGSANITNNKFINRGVNGTGRTAYYFWSNLTGSISGNDYGTYLNLTEVYSVRDNTVIFPEIK